MRSRRQATMVSRILSADTAARNSASRCCSSAIDPALYPSSASDSVADQAKRSAVLPRWPAHRELQGVYI